MAYDFKMWNVLIIWTSVTVITPSIGADRPLQTVLTEIRYRSIQHPIRVYTVCHTYSSIVDTSRGSRMDCF